MDMTTTLYLLALGVVMFGFANWRSRRPYQPGNLPLIPDTALQFVGVVIVIVMAAHLITLITGVPFAGRSGF